MRRLLLPSLVAALLLSRPCRLLGAGPASAAAPTASPAERWALVVGVTDYAGRDPQHRGRRPRRRAGGRTSCSRRAGAAHHIRVLTERARRRRRR